jgi:TfoX/Sxy family transcriptional regulator of competence genes
VAYDEELAERVREGLAGRKGVTEQKMFGGIGFMLGGNMCLGVYGSDLIVRPGPEQFDSAIKRPHARQMTMGKMTAKGMLFVAAAGVKSRKDLDGWIKMGADHATSLPAKVKAKKPPTKAKKRT